MPGRPTARMTVLATDMRIGTVASLVVLTGLTAVFAPLLGEDEIVLVTMLFLLVVLLASATWGYVVGLFSAVLADLLLNIFFVPHCIP